MYSDIYPKVTLNFSATADLHFKHTPSQMKINKKKFYKYS